MSTIREPSEPLRPTGRDQFADATLRESAVSFGAPHSTRVNLLDCLRDRFVPVRDLDPGGESDVLLVKDRDDQLWVVKQYRVRGWSPAGEVLEILSDLRVGSNPAKWSQSSLTRHLLWMADWGVDPASGLFYEVQEYLPRGSLAGTPELMSQAALPVLIDALVDCIAGFHTSVGAHRDVKPANVLVRDVDPPVFVLADVGLARQVGELSARMSRRDGSAAYQAPEAAQGMVSRAGDWWAVGMMVAQAALGRHPLALPDGTMPDNQHLLVATAQRDIPLDDIADDRIKLLCQGLLTRDAPQRWGLAQVRAWQAGDSPQVVGAVAPTSRIRTVLFQGRDYGSPVELASAMAADPQAAGEILFARRDATVLEDLRLMLLEIRLDAAAGLMESYRSGAWQPTLLRLIAEMGGPGMLPELAGVDISPANVAALALDGARGRELDDRQHLALAWVAKHDVWRLWRRMSGMSEAPACAERLRSLTQSLDPQLLVASYAQGELVWQLGGEPYWEAAPAPTRSVGKHTLVSVEECQRLVASRHDLVDYLQLLAATEPQRFAAALPTAVRSAATSSPAVSEQQWWLALSNSAAVPSQVAALALQPVAIAAAAALDRAKVQEQARLQKAREDADREAERKLRDARAAELRGARGVRNQALEVRRKRLRAGNLLTLVILPVVAFGAVWYGTEPLIDLVSYDQQESVLRIASSVYLLGEIGLLWVRHRRHSVRHIALVGISAGIATYAVFLLLPSMAWEIIYGLVPLYALYLGPIVAPLAALSVWMWRRHAAKKLRSQMDEPAICDDPRYSWSAAAGDWVG